jgi:hypothetical protein
VDHPLLLDMELGQTYILIWIRSPMEEQHRCFIYHMAKLILCPLRLVVLFTLYPQFSIPTILLYWLSSLLLHSSIYYCNIVVLYIWCCYCHYDDHYCYHPHDCYYIYGIPWNVGFIFIYYYHIFDYLPHDLFFMSVFVITVTLWLFNVAMENHRF